MAYQRKRKVEVEVASEQPLELETAENSETNVEIPTALEFVAPQDVEEVQQSAPPEEKARIKTKKVFLTEEDKRLFKKFNQHIIKKLGLTANRSVKI